MRIAFITNEYVTEETFSGGLANYLGRITTALADRGHEVHVFTRSMAGNEVIDHRGVTVHRVVPLWDRKMRLDRIDGLCPRSLYAPYQDLKAAWSLWVRWKRAQQKTPFDLIQAANVLGVGLFFRGLKHVPRVMRLSSYRPVWDTAAGVEQNRATKTRWWMERVVIESFPHLYAPTSYVARLTEENYRVPKVNVIETPFYLEEPEEDYSVFQEVCAGKEYLLFFGRMTQMKGTHLLAQALPQLLFRYPEAHAIFVGGNGPSPDGDPMPDFIRRQTAEFSDRVHLLGSLRHQQLYPLIRNARIVALPSLMDNLPNTCLEAMALGRTVVATTGTCFEQLIESGQSGVLVEPGNVTALAEGLIKAWELEPEQREQIGQAAQERIEELHPDRKVPELIAYYQRIIESHLQRQKSPVPVL
ncbi:MAG: glycosyltransferase family 4 protein [Planctomycetaceae bacterium]|nr:glycosyltransferase family 4 protein [Planctomycetaceae bacterium]